jgi:hypothetical protein
LVALAPQRSCATGGIATEVAIVHICPLFISWAFETIETWGALKDNRLRKATMIE